MAFIRIDPVHPVVWRSPRAIQVGAEPPMAVFDPLIERDERMLAAARAGIPSEGLAAVGGCSAALAAAFLDRIRPTLERPEPKPLGAAVRVLSGAREEIVRTVRMLGLAGGAPGSAGGARGSAVAPGSGGAPGSPVAPAPGPRPRVGVVIADHAVPLRAYRDWMREGVPHIAVVFGARAVTVGPVVFPGATGCLRCADLRRTAADPAWPAIAAQLVGTPAAAARDAVARTEALCAATRLARAVARGTVVAGVGERIEADPECGCTLDLQRSAAG